MQQQHNYKGSYLVLFTKGQNWREGMPFREQLGVDLHDKYMEELRACGKLLLGRPFADSSASAAIFLAQNLEEAQQIVEVEPMVLAGVLQADLYTWSGSVPALDL